MGGRLLCTYTFISVLLAWHTSAKVIILTDENFDHQTQQGTWLIEAHSPWCHLCKELAPIWERLADELEGEQYVAKIDVTQQRVLLQRFAIQGFPAIFHLKDGATREYEGHRTFKEILHFARVGYKTVPPQPFYRAPNSAFGRVYGNVLGIPKAAGQTYLYLNREKGFSDLALVSVILAVPISIGLTAICALDAYHTRASMAARPHYD